MLESATLNFPPPFKRLFFPALVALFFTPPAYAQGESIPGETYESGRFALYLPEQVTEARGILLALGGPDTRAFLTGKSFGAPFPELEAALQELGRELRALAAHHKLAFLGTSLQGIDALSNTEGSDSLILEVIEELAAISGHGELARAPIFIYGISGGTPEASGFAARNPGRVAALLLKVPGVPERLQNQAAPDVPTFVILADNDAYTDNEKVLEVFEYNRGSGGLWAVAVQPGVPHHSLTPDHRAITVNWLRAVVELRLGHSPDEDLQDIPESTGWLGQPGSGVASWETYRGDRSAASWFPSRATAEEWWAFINP